MAGTSVQPRLSGSQGFEPQRENRMSDYSRTAPISLKVNDIVRRKDHVYGEYDRYQEGIVKELVGPDHVKVQWPKEAEISTVPVEALEKDTMNPNLATKYAKFIIRNPADFTAIEIQGVSRICLNGEIFFEADDGPDPEMYSVYARSKKGPCDCVGDFGKYEAALEYAESLVRENAAQKWDLVDYVEIASQSQSPRM